MQWKLRKQVALIGLSYKRDNINMAENNGLIRGKKPSPFFHLSFWSIDKVTIYL